MTEKIFDGSLFWIEDGDVGVVRGWVSVSEREWVCQARCGCATEGARVAATEGARRLKAGLVSSELLAHADDRIVPGIMRGRRRPKWSEMGK